MKAVCFYGNKSWEHLKSLPTNFNGSNLSGFFSLIAQSAKMNRNNYFSIAKWQKREKWNFLKKNSPKYLADWNNLHNIALINTEQTFYFESSKYEIMEKQIDKEGISKRDIILNE